MRFRSSTVCRSICFKIVKYCYYQDSLLKHSPTKYLCLSTQRFPYLLTFIDLFHVCSTKIPIPIRLPLFNLPLIPPIIFNLPEFYYYLLTIFITFIRYLICLIIFIQQYSLHLFNYTLFDLPCDQITWTYLTLGHTFYYFQAYFIVFYQHLIITLTDSLHKSHHLRCPIACIRKYFEDKVLAQNFVKLCFHYYYY